MTDMATRVGSLTLPAPVLTASGTAGHGAELSNYFDLSELGAVVVKSLRVESWPGNQAPRVHSTSAAMINSVGLQGPGIERWLADELPALISTGARVIASIWGSTVDDYRLAAEALSDAPPEVVAVEVNVSCPNLEDRRRMFAHSASVTAEVVAATESVGRPRWAKLSPNVADIAEIAMSAVDAGAEAVVLVNTLLAMAIDTDTRRPVLGAKRGGMSGAALHPVAIRAVYDVHEAAPDLAIVGVGGASTGADVVEFLLAGASAVEIGTATFANPRAPQRILGELQQWCRKQGVQHIEELIGEAHG